MYEIRSIKGNDWFKGFEEGASGPICSFTQDRDEAALFDTAEEAAEMIDKIDKFLGEDLWLEIVEVDE